MPKMASNSLTQSDTTSTQIHDHKVSRANRITQVLKSVHERFFNGCLYIPDYEDASQPDEYHLHDIYDKAEKCLVF